MTINQDQAHEPERLLTLVIDLVRELAGIPAPEVVAPSTIDADDRATREYVAGLIREEWLASLAGSSYWIVRVGSSAEIGRHVGQGSLDPRGQLRACPERSAPS